MTASNYNKFTYVSARKLKRVKWYKSTYISLLFLPVIAFPFYFFNEPKAEAKVISPISIAPVIPTPTDTFKFRIISVEEKATQRDIEDYIRTIFGKDAQIAIAISHGECNPANATYPKCQLHTSVENSIGIFQINIQSDTAKIHWARIPGKTLEEKKKWLEDPYNNTLMAYWIFTKSDWYPWTAFTSGAYQKYL